MKIELGFLKYKSVTLNMDTKINSSEIVVNTLVEGFERPEYHINGFNMVGTVKIDDLSIKGSNFEVLDLSLYKLNPPRVLHDVFTAFEKISSKCDIILNSDFNVNVSCVDVSMDTSIEIKSMKTLAKGCQVFHANIDVGTMMIRNFKNLAIRKVIYTDRLIPAFIFSAVFLPSRYVKKEELYDALRKLKMQYDVNLLKFFAYYENIPIDIAKAIKILSNRSLLVEFEKGKISSRKNVLKNILVFKYEDHYIYHII
ncbi:MAG: hypothetical protein WBH69_08020 [Fervidobacterium sp.]